MSHANALLTPRARLRLARLVVDQGWTCTAAARMFMVSPRTAAKWADRYRCEGSAGMVDAPPQPDPDAPAGAAADRGVAVAAPARPGPDRRPARLGGLDGACGVDPVPDQPAVPDRPGHRPTAATLRTRPSRVDGPCRCDQVLATFPPASAGATWPSSASPTNGPGPTGPRPTAKSRGSTAPLPTAGPTPASTPQKPNAEPPCPDGSTSTITTEPTPPP